MWDIISCHTADREWFLESGGYPHKGAAEAECSRLDDEWKKRSFEAGCKHALYIHLTVPSETCKTVLALLNG